MTDHVGWELHRDPDRAVRRGAEGGWSDAAYKSSIKLLNAKYGQALPGLKPKAALMRSIGPRSATASWSGR